MKKTFLQKLKSPVVTACYLVAITIYILCSLVSFSVSMVNRLTGAVQMHTVLPQDLQLVNIEILPNGTLKSTNEDPQIIFDNRFGNIENLRIHVEYSMPPGENCLYYESDMAKSFGQHKRVWQNEKTGDIFEFSVPVGTKVLRWDPSNANQIEMQIKNITLNYTRGFFDYFRFDGGIVFCMVVLPAMAAAIISFFIECTNYYFKDKKTKTERNI